MWRKITEDDLLSAISAAEDAGIRRKLVTDNQTDPLQQIIAQQTLTFREAIRSFSGNQLAADPATLPEAAIFHAVAIIRHRLIGRLGVSEMTEDRKLEYRAANKYLEGLTRGEPRVEDPNQGETAKPAVAPLAVNQSPRRDGWRDQNGI